MPSAVASNGSDCICEDYFHCKCWHNSKATNMCLQFLHPRCNSYSHHLGTFESKRLIMTILLYDRVYEQSIPFKRQVSNGLGHITSMLLLT